MLRIALDVRNKAMQRLFYQPAIQQRLKQIGECIEYWKEVPSLQNRQRMLEQTDILITCWGSQELGAQELKNSPLKMIVHSAGALKGIVAEDIFGTGIKIVSANAAFGRTVAEFNLLLILMGLRRSYEVLRDVRNNVTQKTESFLADGLSGKTVGILGYGNIARHLVKYLKPFDVRIIVWCEYTVSQKQADEEGIEIKELDTVLKESDVLCVLNALTPESYHMIGARELGMMKEGSLLVNTGRGPIVEEGALLERLRAKQLYACLDVYESEPLAADSELRKLENVYAFPHVGGKTKECRENMVRLCVEEVERFAWGKPLEYSVSKSDFLRMTDNRMVIHTQTSPKV